MNFNSLRTRFSEAHRAITLGQFYTLSVDEVNILIADAKLSSSDSERARAFHPFFRIAGTAGNAFYIVSMVFKIILLALIFALRIQHNPDRWNSTIEQKESTCDVIGN